MITAGTRIGPYEVKSPLGEGGMGVVFRARDTVLQRDVALKLIPDTFAKDADRLSRFQREAQVLASLNHAHIAQIYGFEGTDSSRCIVMELVEGETLQERLRRGPIPMDEALPIAKQIAEALEAAHEKGIIHRDLKPGNIKFTPEGKVKVLDFGLAKVHEAESTAASLSNSPTLLSHSTPGMIMGTAAYMSPEQAKGKLIDRTTDVWAFGCVLYEMLTGWAVFDGETPGEILGGIFKAEPEWQRLPIDTPEGIRRLLRRCMEKDRNLRLHDIADARIEIHYAQHEPHATPRRPASASRRMMVVLVSVLVVVALVAAFALVRAFRPLPSASEMRLEISTPPTADPVSLAISPDGHKIVFVAASEGQSRLWLRPLDAVTARSLAGTDGASFPFWSPDSESVAFFADGKLKRIDMDRGSLQILADAGGGRGGSWNRAGTIIFSPLAASPIFRVAATGGTPSPVTRIEGGNETGHRFPHFLPDGNHFLYYALGTPESHGICVGDLSGSTPRRLLDVESAPVYAATGELLFVRDGTLFAQGFDTARLELNGNPVSVAERIALATMAQGSVGVSASQAGPLVYRTASAGGHRQMTWYDRSGKDVGKAGDPVAAIDVSISPDGRSAVLGQFINQNIDVWLLELGRGVLSRFTFDSAVDTWPVWSPDSRRIAYESNRMGSYDIYEKPTIGPGSDELLVGSDAGRDKNPTDWSRDGHFLLYTNIDPKTGEDIWAVPLEKDRTPRPLVQTKFDENLGQFSPDGKWIAYESNESGRYEIYVQPFPGPGGKVQVSKNGGAQVRWRRDGKELFYIAFDNQLMAVPIQFASTEQTINAGTPIPLFTTRVGGAVSSPNKQQYDVSLDGQRFLMNTIIDEAAAPITVILNWQAKR